MFRHRIPAPTNHLYPAQFRNAAAGLLKSLICARATPTAVVFFRRKTTSGEWGWGSRC